MNWFSQLLPHIRPLRRRLLIGLLVTCFCTFLSVLPPLLMRALVDRVIEPEAWHFLPLMGAAILLGYLFPAFVQFVNSMWIVGTGQRFIVGLRRHMYAHILSLGMRYHGETSGGMLVNRLMADTTQIEGMVSSETLGLLVNIITLIFSVAIAFTISWRLALVLLVVLLLNFISARIFSRRIRRVGIIYRGMVDEISGRLQEIVAGARQVRIYNREEWETGSFLDRTTQSLKKAFWVSVNSLSLSAVCSAVSGFGATIIVGLGAFMVLKQEISHGDLIAMNTYVWMCVTPSIQLAVIAGHLAGMFVSARRVFEVLAETPAVQSAPGAPRMPRGRGAVEFRNVTFSYSKDAPLFNGLNLSVEPGETVALVGATGCGKTTLTSLLMRQWDVEAGAILIDGVDISTVELESLRSLFGVVLQQPVLFEGSLADNIAYGNPSASREEIEAAGRAAEIHGLAASLRDGYDSLIGSKGTTLSVGEKQRVSIARAILKNPVILIMDEATSALDSESEMLVQRALDRVLEGRTSFVIAHRLSTVVGADRIVTMSYGRIIEVGTHTELMNIHGGIYRSFYEKLLSDKELADT